MTKYYNHTGRKRSDADQQVEGETEQELSCVLQVLDSRGISAWDKVEQLA